jgi:hypothetical protein
VSDSLSDVAIELNIATIRSRIVEALQGDDEALSILARVFPADWGDAPLAVVWMLGNAARFATNTTGFSAEYSQNWLDRLVYSDGEPREEIALDIQHKALTEALQAAIEGLNLAADCHEAIRMDSAEDEATKMRAVGTMRLALAAAKRVAADAGP